MSGEASIRGASAGAAPPDRVLKRRVLLRQIFDWRTLRSEFDQLLREGCLTLRTPPDAGPGDRLLAETLVRIDGDFLFFVDPEALDDPDVLASHHERVHALNDRWRAIFSSGRFGYRVLFVTSVASGPLYGLWLWVDQGWQSALVWFLTPLIPEVVKRIGFFALRRYVERRFQSSSGAGEPATNGAPS